MYGLGYRYLPDSIGTGPWFRAEPVHRHTQVFSAFVQDEIGLVEDRLRLTLGTKVEHNDYTSWETQPSARLAWLPTDRQTLWAAVSRAVQVPSRVFNDTLSTDFSPSAVLSVPAPGFGMVPGFLAATAPQGRKTISQKVIAYEFGYRMEATERVYFDIATFYNHYEDFLIVGDITPSFRLTPFPHYLFDLRLSNGGEADTYGFEVASEWRVTDSWRLIGAYTFLREHLDEVAVTKSQFPQVRDPRHQVSLRSSMNLPGNLEFDVWGRFVDRVLAFNVGSYFDLDVRLAWKPVKNLEVALVGQNLIESERVEFGPQAYIPTQITAVPRGGYLQISYRY